MFLPFFLYPFFITKFGMTEYGMYIFIQTLFSFVIPIVSLGLNSLLVKYISQSQIDSSYNKDISSSIILRLISFVIVYPTSLGVILYFKRDVDLLLILSCSWILIHELLNPTWFYLGVERLKMVTVFNFLNRGIFAIVILYLIQFEVEVYTIPLLNGSLFLILDVVLLIIFFKNYLVEFKFIFDLKSLLVVFNSGKKLLITSFAGLVKDKLNSYIIGAYIGYEELTLYNLLDKIFAGMSNLFYSFSSAMFPRFLKSRTKVFPVFYFSILISFLFSVILYFAFPYMIEIMNVNINIINFNQVIILFSLIFILRHISNFYGNVVLVNLGKLRFLAFNTILSAILFVGVVFVFYLIDKINVFNLLLAMFLSLLYESLGRLFYFKRSQI
jgi:PST family polysaccharide transporter